MNGPVCLNLQGKQAVNEDDSLKKSKFMEQPNKQAVNEDDSLKNQNLWNSPTKERNCYTLHPINFLLVDA